MAEQDERKSRPDAFPETAQDGRDGGAGGPSSAGSAESSADAAGDSDDPQPASLEQRIAELERQAESFRDQALRSQAEAENTRRRASRDVENAHKYALEKFSADLLPVLDSLEKAVEVAGQSEGADSIAQGVELSLKLFLSVLEKHGIERIDPTGEPFDPQVHEAMTMVPSAHAEPNSVLEVMQAGYLLNGRVVRAAKVVVAKAPEQ